jgi:riboflavin synthase
MESNLVFTGLVEDLGHIVGLLPRGNGVELTIRTRLPLAEVEIGDSIAVNGVCLTVERCDGDCFVATAGRETMDKTSLVLSKVGRRVHLERALRVGDRLGGHFVQGHVDGVGRLVSISDQQESWVLWIEVPEHLARYVANKGSVCLDGVSLTVNELSGRTLRVNIVPHTIDVTNLGNLSPGDPLNIEVDILAKYVERMVMGAGESGGLTMEELKRTGFVR